MVPLVIRVLRGARTPAQCHILFRLDIWVKEMEEYLWQNDVLFKHYEDPVKPIMERVAARKETRI